MAGYGKATLAFCEEAAIQGGYNGIRLDVFSKNEDALRFYENRGYSKKGEVAFASKPANNQIYYCLEKIINPHLAINRS